MSTSGGAGNLSAHTLLDVQLDTVLETLAGEVAIDLRDASDTGMSDRDNVTSKDALSLVGVAEVGASVTILAAGKTLGVTQVGSDETDFLPGDGLGAWNLTLRNGLVAGTWASTTSAGSGSARGTVQGDNFSGRFRGGA